MTTLRKKNPTWEKKELYEFQIISSTIYILLLTSVLYTGENIHSVIKVTMTVLYQNLGKAVSFNDVIFYTLDLYTSDTLALIEL